MTTILVIEDDESNRATLSALLEIDGFAVQTAASFTEAQAILSSPALLDVVLLDQNLGDGVGSDLYDPIRRSRPETRIVLMSGSCEETLPVTAADGFFEKGQAFPELVALVRSLLERDR